MLRTSLAVISCLALAVPACRTPPPNPPEDPHPSEPVAQDPIEGDPTDIEGDEIGEDHTDSAKVVEPGPAETEVQTGESFEQPD
jgi:hypothetical protein